jgi:hypothetical protein
MQRNDLLGVLVATFPIRACADEAIRDLHRAGVRHTWLGVTKCAEEGGAQPAGADAHERVEGVGIGHVIARWFHRDRDETLYDVLCEHGVAERLARRIDGAIAEGSPVLVAEDVIDLVEAAKIIIRHGGTMLVTPEEIELSASASIGDPLSETRIEAARRHPVRGARSTSLPEHQEEPWPRMQF